MEKRNRYTSEGYSCFVLYGVPHVNKREDTPNVASLVYKRQSWTDKESPGQPLHNIRYSCTFCISPSSPKVSGSMQTSR
jgi:hypothetical protein